MKKNFFTENDKFADLLAANHNLIFMLPRFGIAFGFGDKNVNEVCQHFGVSRDFFLLICNVYTFDAYLPSQKTILATDMQPLVPFLLASHHYYLRERLPHIENHLTKIAEQSAEKHGNTLKQFFTGYKNEVANHFAYEENILFPYIQKLTCGTADSSYRIGNFADDHSNIEDKLEDLTNIIIKYLPGTSLINHLNSVLFDIFELADDLNKHALIENKILVPYVQQLERKGSK